MVNRTSLLVFFVMTQDSSFDFSWQNMAGGFGPVGWAVIVILLLMSIWSFGVMLDRALMYAAARKHSRIFIRQVAGALREGNLDEAIRIAERNKKSHIAKVTATGLTEFQQAAPRMNHEKVVESARRSLDRSVAIVHAEFERGLASLATIGSTAPFVGLFGTVVGILTAFGKISADKQAGFPVVAGGISEALVATALGLLVAIPAVWAFNAFTNRLKAFSVEMDSSSAELVNYFVARLEEKSKEADMGMNVGRRKGIVAEMNVVPLIDVLLVLLIIFMVITPLAPKGLEALIPQQQDKTSQSEPPERDPTIVVQVSADGQLRINQQETNWQELGAQLSEIFSRRAQRVAFVQGDAVVLFQDVARAIALMRDAGVESVGLLTPSLLAAPVTK